MNETCSFPNCTNPVMDIDVDHVTAWAQGGQTTGNTHNLCRRHHALKHFRDDKNKHGHYRQDLEPDRHGIKLRGWKPSTTNDGRIAWTSPNGNYHAPKQRTAQPPAYPKWLKKHLTQQLDHRNNTTAGLGTGAAAGTAPGARAAGMAASRFDRSHSPLENLIEYNIKPHTNEDH
ncbi:HNH endonuclease [Arthrobacter frigidicola]|nr:HNH endonuclease [Arthrobacter frigidicola]